MSTRPVVVGVDGSPESRAALRLGVEEAARLGVVVRLVHVVPDVAPLVTTVQLDEADLTATGTQILRVATQEAHALAAHVRVTPHLQHGPVVPALAAEAAEAQLLVVGRDDRSVVDRLLLGDTAAGVACRTGCPVVVVPSTWEPRAVRGTVLVGLRSPHHSVELLTDAFALAAAAGCRVRVLHAWSLPRGYAHLGDAPRRVEEWSQRSGVTLEGLLAPWRVSYPEVDLEVQAVHGPPVEVLREASREADVLVLVRRAHGVPAWVHLGSTGRALLRVAESPVRVVAPSRLDGVPGLVLEEAGALSR